MKDVVKPVAVCLRGRIGEQVAPLHPVEPQLDGRPPALRARDEDVLAGLWQSLAVGEPRVEWHEGRSEPPAARLRQVHRGYGVKFEPYLVGYGSQVPQGIAELLTHPRKPASMRLAVSQELLVLGGHRPCFA